MVLYLNVNVGQRVEARYRGRLYKGTVRYKGSVVSKRGDWVGIELDSPDGQHNGTYYGRHYFKCRPLHGVFVESSNIRFIPLKRCLYNRYRRVEDEEKCEEHLFRRLTYSINPASRDGSVMNGSVSAREPVDILPYGGGVPRAKSQLGHTKAHTLTKEILAANTPKRPKTAASLSSGGIYRSSRNGDEFCSTPTIPKTHMPHEDQVNLVKRGWGGNHLIRESTVSTFRDSLSGKFWNDVSF